MGVAIGAQVLDLSTIKHLFNGAPHNGPGTCRGFLAFAPHPVVQARNWCIGRASLIRQA